MGLNRTWVEMRMDVKTSGADVRSLAQIKKEKEVLLRRGSKFKVVSAEQVIAPIRKTKGWIIHVREVPQ